MVLALVSLTYISALLLASLASPVEQYPHEVLFNPKPDRAWLSWGWAWGSESTVSVVDRTPTVSFASRPAAFGAEITDPLLGYVIPLSAFTVPCNSNSTDIASLPENSGCPDLCLSGPHKPTETWIALIQRGKCEFVKKVREAQRLGAKAVVIGGEDPEVSGFPDTLVNMYSPEDASDIDISATYIKYSDYSELYRLISLSNTTHSGLRTLTLVITAEYSAWEWYSPIITFVIILLLPSALTFITLLIHRIRASRAAQRDRAPEDVVRNMEWRVWTGQGWEKHEGSEDVTSVPDNVVPDGDVEQGLGAKDNSIEDRQQADSDTTTTDIAASTSLPLSPPAEQPWFETQMECAICLSEFAKGDKVRVLPCHHIFHMHEVDEWLIQRKKLCPVCKADVTQPPPPPPVRPYTTPDQPHPQPTSSPNSTERTPLLSSPSQEHNDEPPRS